jgi:hypothetical protein
MSVTFEPAGNYVLLALEPDPEQSTIIQVQRSTEGLVRFGVVQAVGPEVRDARPGMRVMAGISAGVEIPGGILIRESSIMGLET